jgi:hypothetical protein
MGTFAVLNEDNKVENIIVAESKEIAEEVVGLTCVEYFDENKAHIGLGYSDGVFEQPADTEPTPHVENETIV